jgi:hypothetical protein
MANKYAEIISGDGLISVQVKTNFSDISSVSIIK